VPDFSNLTRSKKRLAVNIPTRRSQSALHLLIDSTGIKGEGEGERNARKHGGNKRSVWCKVLLEIDEEYLEIRVINFISKDVLDAPLLPKWLV
jgi:Transposase DDE domain